MRGLPLLYGLFITLLSPFIFLFYLFRLWRTKKERKTWRGRMGFALPAKQEGKAFLLHGVSAGEVQLACLLAEEIKKQFPQSTPFVSTITDTGFSWLTQKAPKYIHPCILPLDVPYLTYPFLKRINPVFIGILETELWPSFLLSARLLKIPVFLFNARLSDKSFPKYRSFSFLVRAFHPSIALVFTLSAEQKRRWEACGFPQEKVCVAGNLKIDLVRESRKRIFPLEAFLPKGKKMLTVGSTHEGEEALLIDALQPFLKNHRDFYIVLAPRHPERALRVRDLMRKRGFDFALRSEEKGGRDGMILDSVGELAGCLARSTLALLGGSFVPVGGHNFLEAIACGVPVIVGPHMQNFADFMEDFGEETGLFCARLENLSEVAERVLREGKEKAQKGMELLRKKRGVASFILQELQGLFPHVCQKLA